MSKSYNILAERLESNDKDFRYMAASDLLNELQKGPIQLDPLMQNKLCAALLKTLQDTSSEVQSIALKALPLLLIQSEFHLLETVVQVLVSNLLHIAEDDTKSNLQRNTVVSAAKNVSRDNCLITLKSLLSLVDPNTAGDSLIGKKVIPKILSCARNNSSLEVKLDCFDILYDITSRFSFVIVQVADEFVEILSGYLFSPHNMIRKRAIHCLALFLSNAPSTHLQSFMDSLLSDLGHKIQVNGQAVDKVRNSLSAIQAICKVAGSRALHPYISTITELVLKLLEDPAWTEDEELYESALQILELFLQNVPLEMESFQSSIVSALENALKYDPNLVEQDDEEEWEQGSDSEMEEDDFTDDEDLSGKVRRVSARCIHAIFLARNFYKPSFPLPLLVSCMIQRIQERDEQVLLEILSGLMDLLKNISAYADEEKNAESSIYAKVLSVWKDKSGFIISKLQPSFKSRSLSLKNTVLLFMKEFVVTCSAWLTESDLMSISEFYIEPCFLKENNVSIQFDGIVLLECCAPLFRRYNCASHLAVFLTHLVNIGAQGYYRVTAQSLRTCKCICSLLTQQDLGIVCVSDALLQVNNFAIHRLEISDQDTEVKEAAMECLSTLCALFPELVSSSKDKSLRLILDKLQDEFVRITAIRSFSNILQSPLRTKIDDSILLEFWQQVISLVRKKDAKLRESCLESIDNSITLIPHQLDSSLLTELTGWIDASEWKRTALILEIFAKLLALREEEGFLLRWKQETYPVILNLLVSSPLQGKLKDSVVHLFQTMMCSLRCCSYFPVTNVFQDMLSLVESNPRMHSSVMKNLSSVVSIFWKSNVDVKALCPTMLNILEAPLLDEKSKSSKLFVLFILNELGYMESVKELDLSDKMEAVLYQWIRGEDEEIVGAAAAALGSLIRFVDQRGGGISQLISFVRRTETRERYVYLVAVKEAILCQIHLSSLSLLNDMDALTRSLIDCVQDADNAMQETGNREKVISTDSLGATTTSSHIISSSSSMKESIRSISSECLGILLAVSPLRLFVVIQQAMQSPNVQVRWTSLLAVKAAFSYLTKTESSVDLFIQYLEPYLPRLLELLEDPNADVDTAAISLVTTCARLCPEVLKDYVAKILNILLSHTEHRPDLMKTVDLGPFKHSVDEGIALRKAAFEALLALLPSFLSSFQDENVSESLVDALTKGLKDHQDVRGVVEKLFNYLLTNEDAFQLLLASKDGDSKLSKIVAVLSDMVSSKPKENAVAQEMEKHKVSKCFYWMK